MKPCAALIALALMLPACTTLRDAKEGRGSGTTRTYDEPFDIVWNAALEVVDETDLELVTDNKEKGEILAQHEMSAFSYGENVAIYVDASGPDETNVEVISKKTMQTNVFAQNWETTILDRLDKKLVASR